MEQDHISNSEILCESICKMNFVNISRDTVGQKLANGSFSLVAIPVSAVKSPSDSVRGIKVTEDQYAPFLCCKNCKKLFIWFKETNGKWVNQSGYNHAKEHSSKCSRSSSTIPIKNYFQANSNKLSTVSSSKWKELAVKELCQHPTVSLRAGCALLSSAANFASKLSNPSKCFLFDLSPVTISRHITSLGQSAENGLVNRLKSLSLNKECSVSAIIDFWSARQIYYRSYGGILATGIDSKWQWFSFPVSFFDVSHEQPHTAEFIFSQFDQRFCSDISFSNPLFVCTDNAASMIAAFDGRFFNSTHVYRSACVEHRLSTCVSDSFKAGLNEEMDILWKRISAIETFFNSSSDKAAILNKAIPHKCSTREWRSQIRRLAAVEANFAVFLSSQYPQVQNNIPDIVTVRGLSMFLRKIKECFDVLEVDGPTIHLVLPCYCLLEYFCVKMSYIAENVNDLVKSYVLQFKVIMEEKLWPVCASNLAITASFLAGIDIKERIEGLIKSFPKADNNVQNWALSWKDFISTFEKKAENYILDNFSSFVDQKASLIVQDDEAVECKDLNYFLAPSTKRAKTNTTLAEELSSFRSVNHNASDTLAWWSKAHDLPLLGKVAKSILSVPASSAAVERLFSVAGLRLSKHRANTTSNLLRYSLFIKCAENLKLDINMANYTNDGNEILDEELSD